LTPGRVGVTVADRVRVIVGVSLEVTEDVGQGVKVGPSSAGSSGMVGVRLGMWEETAGDLSSVRVALGSNKGSD
jgi:predicted ABC-type transport system involved in lysophospholipase L1 biosynthesis ATPase subunit